MPACESSTAAHCCGATPSRRPASRYTSGAGLPPQTSSDWSSTPSRSKTTALINSDGVVRALAVDERVVGRSVLDREDVGDEEGVVAGIGFGARLRLEPAERALDQRRDAPLPRGHVLPMDDRRIAGCEAARELLLL